MAEQALDVFRRDLRSWLEENVPRDLGPERTAGLPEDERIRQLRAWQRRLAEARWVGITWPREYGGRDAGIPEQLVYVEEMARAGAPEIIGNLGIGIAGPPILAYGSEAQKRRFAPRILTADDLVAHAGGAQGRLLRGDRPEGLDDARAPRRLVHASLPY